MEFVDVSRVMEIHMSVVTRFAINLRRLSKNKVCCPARNGEGSVLCLLEKETKFELLAGSDWLISTDLLVKQPRLSWSC